MPHLFALQGPGNCGKSDTLIRLFHALLTKYPSATIQALHSGTKDIAVIMRGVNGLVVGIESQGDPNSRLQRSLPAFAAAKCDIIFCACRTSGMTVGWVNALSAAYSIHFVAQTVVANNHGATNASTASSLLRQAGIQAQPIIPPDLREKPRRPVNSNVSFLIQTVLSKPRTEEYKETVAWLKGHAKNYFPYQPDQFVPGEVEFWNPTKRWKIAFGKNAQREF